MFKSMRIGRALGLAAALATAGCGLLSVPDQQRRIDALCEVMGTVSTAQPQPRPIVVVLARPTAERGWKIVDHFVLEGAGRWAFVAPAGRYRVAAFAESRADATYQPGEPFVASAEEGVACGAGEDLHLELSIPAVAAGNLDQTFDLSELHPRSLEGQVDTSLGQLTALGKITTLGDPRFSQENAENGQWRPFDFITASYAGIYFLEPDDPSKIPVLFVHGIAGTPASFDYYVSRLDRSRFQPWFYYYPSGTHLPRIADHLAQTVAKLQRRNPHPQIVVIAHSMGGLVARGFIQRHAALGTPGDIQLFITISTPWGGHNAAASGVKHSPIVVRVWEDMAPGSEYLREIFDTPLPAKTVHQLFFTYNRKEASFGPSDDEAVTVASQLRPAAQAGAFALHGFDDTHTSVLRDPEVAALINKQLEKVR